MIGHTVVNNERVTDMMAPWASQSIHYMKLGTEMAVEKVQDMIHDLKSGDEHVLTEEVVHPQPDETKVEDVQNVQDAQEIQLQRLDGVTESEEDEGIEKQETIVLRGQRKKMQNGNTRTYEGSASKLKFCNIPSQYTKPIEIASNVLCVTVLLFPLLVQ